MKRPKPQRDIAATLGAYSEAYAAANGRPPTSVYRPLVYKRGFVEFRLLNGDLMSRCRVSAVEAMTANLWARARGEDPWAATAGVPMSAPRQGETEEIR